MPYKNFLSKGKNRKANQSSYGTGDTPISKPIKYKYIFKSYKIIPYMNISFKILN